jgi:iduronate 2-sulfatase
MIIIAPGVTKPGGIVSTPVSQVDLYPTLAELCGIGTPSNLQGQSLVPMLDDPNSVGRGWALTQVTRGGGQARATITRDRGSDGRRFFGYSLRTSRWRYTQWDEGHQGHQLYDHDADPREQINLADDPDHADIVRQLSDQLRAAVEASFPPPGQTPPILPGAWAPNLTDP